jgi:hypothetical protein
MKISKNKLRQIIREEYSRLLREGKSNAEKLASLIASNDLESIRQALSLGKTIGLIPRYTEYFPGEFSVIVPEEFWTLFRYPTISKKRGYNPLKHDPKEWEEVFPSSIETDLSRGFVGRFHRFAYENGKKIPGHTLMTIDVSYQIDGPRFKLVDDGKTTQRRPLDYELKDGERELPVRR